MKCPFCGDLSNQVIDSRLGKGSMSIRRRRKCFKCDRRFTTYEKIEEQITLLIKKDGRREAFSRDKMKIGIMKAAEKTMVSSDLVDVFIENLERQFHETNLKEISTRSIGDKIINFLKETDPIAYFRFASVYHSFSSLEEFNHELQKLSLLPNDTSTGRVEKYEAQQLNQ